MIENLVQFIDNAPTAYHAVEQAKEKLKAKQFKELKEADIWQLEARKKYFVTRNDSSIIAFTVPQKFETIQICASHTDSPTFKLKMQGTMISKGHIRLDVERYGGAILHSWVDRPLSLAGRVVVENNGQLEVKLFDVKKACLMIPSVAIHLNREANGGNGYNVQKELLPVAGLGEDFNLHDFIRKECQITGEILGLDAFVYNLQSSLVWGQNNEFFSAPRIDNLECFSASLEAFIDSENNDALNILCSFDNEEVGSSTKQGADSNFFSDVLERIEMAMNLKPQEMKTLISKGFMISCDNAHGFHPAYPELYSPSVAPLLNQGIVIKHSANQKYTTDAISGAVFKNICQKASVACQDYHNHSNLPGGSTLGNISNTHISLNTIDIGLAQWAMHSSFETCGREDYQKLIDALKYFYQNKIQIKGCHISD